MRKRREGVQNQKILWKSYVHELLITQSVGVSLEIVTS